MGARADLRHGIGRRGREAHRRQDRQVHEVVAHEAHVLQRDRLQIRQRTDGLELVSHAQPHVRHAQAVGAQLSGHRVPR